MQDPRKSPEDIEVIESDEVIDQEVPVETFSGEEGES